MEDQIQDLAGDGLGVLVMEFTKYESYDEKKFDIDVSFEYDMQNIQQTIG